MRRKLAILALIALAFLGYMYFEAHRDPLMRTATLPLAGLPRGQKPLRVAIFGDTHLSSLGNNPARLDRLVAAVNAQHPDLVLLAGDYIGDREPASSYTREESVAAF